MKNLFVCLLTLFLFSCGKKAEPANPDALRQEIFKAEDEFKNMAQAKGIQEAFYAFADEDAVIKRENDTLVKGKESIKKYYSNPKFKKASVTWKPDFVYVSDDGSMASTYGKYVWTVSDSVGNKQEFKGVFHTVWKKQKDGNWKYIWD